MEYRLRDWRLVARRLREMERKCSEGGLFGSVELTYLRLGERRERHREASGAGGSSRRIACAHRGNEALSPLDGNRRRNKLRRHSTCRRQIMWGDSLIRVSTSRRRCGASEKPSCI